MAVKSRSIQAPPPYITRHAFQFADPTTFQPSEWRLIAREPINKMAQRFIVRELSALGFLLTSLDDDKDKAKEYTESWDERFEGGEGFQLWLARIVDDVCTLPFGGASERGMTKSGDLEWVLHVDGATLMPTYMPSKPYMQFNPNNTTERIYFNQRQLARLRVNPRTDILYKQYQIAPTEDAFLAIEALARMYIYYMQQLSDTPPPGVLDLMDVKADDAADWAKSFRDLLGGIDNIKIPILFEHDKPAKWIPFTQGVQDVALPEQLKRFAEILLAKYGLSIGDLRLFDHEATKAGQRTSQMITERSGVGYWAAIVAAYITRMLREARLIFSFRQPRPERDLVVAQRQQTQMATLQSATGNKNLLTVEDALAQARDWDIFTIEVEEPEEEEALPVNGGQQPPTPTDEEIRQVEEARDQLDDKDLEKKGGAGSGNWGHGGRPGKRGGSASGGRRGSLAGVELRDLASPGHPLVGAVRRLPQHHIDTVAVLTVSQIEDIPYYNPKVHARGRSVEDPRDREKSILYLAEDEATTQTAIHEVGHSVHNALEKQSESFKPYRDGKGLYQVRGELDSLYRDNRDRKNPITKRSQVNEAEYIAESYMAYVLGSGKLRAADPGMHDWMRVNVFEGKTYADNPDVVFTDILPAKKALLDKGGAGSGNFGHAGRPGTRGGSGGGAATYAGEVDAWMSGIESSPRLKAAVFDYTSYRYKDMNEHLRTGDPPRFDDTQSLIEELDGVIASAPRLVEDTVVHRGMSSRHLEGVGVGDVYMDKAFVSTSDAPERTLAANTMVDIVLPKGTRAAPVAPLARYPKEGEWILPRGTTFKVMKVEPATSFKKLTFTMRLIPEGGAMASKGSGDVERGTADKFVWKISDLVRLKRGAGDVTKAATRAIGNFVEPPSAVTDGLNSAFVTQFVDAGGRATEKELEELLVETRKVVTTLEEPDDASL